MPEYNIQKIGLAVAEAVGGFAGSPIDYDFHRQVAAAAMSVDGVASVAIHINADGSAVASIETVAAEFFSVELSGGTALVAGEPIKPSTAESVASELSFALRERSENSGVTNLNLEPGSVFGALIGGIADVVARRDAELDRLHSAVAALQAQVSGLLYGINTRGVPASEVNAHIAKQPDPRAFSSSLATAISASLTGGEQGEP